MLGKKWLWIGLLSLGLGLSAPDAFAKGKGVCKPDVEKFCKDVERGGGGIHRCLQEHKAELAPACQAKLDKMERKRAACKADVEKFCKDVPREKGGLRACLKSHEAELSPECKAAKSS